MFTAEAGIFGDEFIRYLDLVRNGDDILIAESGKIIARIIKEETRQPFVNEELRPLISEGLLIGPTRPPDKGISATLEVPGKPVSEMVTEDRR